MDANLERIAAEARCCDQARVTGDSPALIGLTPGAFARRLSETATR